MCWGRGTSNTATVGTVFLATNISPPPSSPATGHQPPQSPPPSPTPHLQPRKQQQKKTKNPGA